MYIGRFAPSPTGLLHAGSMVAALASWLDARAHNGRWLVRIEDIDAPRCVVSHEEIMRQLHQHGLHTDEPLWIQSKREATYKIALQQLQKNNLCYPCSCTRSQITALLQHQGHKQKRHADIVYPGTCRTNKTIPNTELAWRLNIGACLQQRDLAIEHSTTWEDRRLGLQHQVVAKEVGDFVLRRRDGIWSYQLAVVVDDAAQGITHVVRGEDLLNNTARQIVLQQALGLPQPTYLHTPLVLAPNGEKLSKQNGAQALVAHTSTQALANLQTSASLLGLLNANFNTIQEALQYWVRSWRQKYCQ